MRTCTRRLTFASGHRVFGHESKCANLHGHNYVVEVTAEAPDLDSLGRVIDFGVLKERIGGWLETHWDHSFLFYIEDKPLHKTVMFFESLPGELGRKFCMCLFNPTAENMAHYLLHTVCPEVLRGTGVGINWIRLYETENCWADARL